MTDVFLSYSHKDRDHAARLAEQLGSEFKVWWDPELRSGAAYVSEINQKLAEAKCILVIWSADSLKSRWVTAEAMEGFDSDRLVQVVLNPAMPMVPFKILHWTLFDASPSEKEVARLRQDIRATIGQTPVTEASPAPPPAGGDAARARPSVAERANAVEQMDTQQITELFMGFSTGALMLAALLVALGAALIIASMLLELSEMWTQVTLTSAAVLCGCGVLLMFRTALSFVRAGR